MSLEKNTQLFYEDALISKSHQQSSFRAVKNLVQAQNNIQTVKNRIKVLQMNQQRNINKINLQKALIEKITQTRNQHIDQLRKLGVNKKQRERMTDQIRQKNQQLRQQHKNKMSTIKQEIHQEKFKEYTQTVEQRQFHQSVIFQQKMNSLHQNQQRRNNIAQNQQKSKENIVKFYDDKTKSIYQKNMKQIKRINNSRLNKQKKLNQYASLEMELVQRNSQSQVAYKEMKHKLDSMLGKIRNDKRKGPKQLKSFLNRSEKQNIYGLQNP